MSASNQHSSVEALRDRLYAALRHEKSCTCGECSGGLNAVDSLVEQLEAWKTRAHAAEKVMLGTQEQNEALKASVEIIQNERDEMRQDFLNERGHHAITNRTLEEAEAQVDTLQRLADRAVEQLETWKRRAHAAEKVMLGRQEQLETYEKALREIAEIDLTAHQTRSGAHAYRQTRQFARTVLASPTVLYPATVQRVPNPSEATDAAGVCGKHGLYVGRGCPECAASAPATESAVASGVGDPATRGPSDSSGEPGAGSVPASGLDS